MLWQSITREQSGPTASSMRVATFICARLEEIFKIQEQYRRIKPMVREEPWYWMADIMPRIPRRSSIRAQSKRGEMPLEPKAAKWKWLGITSDYWNMRS